MFVRLVKKKNDHVSIRIVENVKIKGKVKQKTVCCVGHFHKDKAKEIKTHKRFGEELRIPIGIDDIFESTFRQLSLFGDIDTG